MTKKGEKIEVAVNTGDRIVGQLIMERNIGAKIKRHSVIRKGKNGERDIIVLIEVGPGMIDKIKYLKYYSVDSLESDGDGDTT